METYKVKYSPNHSDEVKYITIECYTAHEAEDYAAMYFDANQIHEIIQLPPKEAKKTIIFKPNL